MHFETANCIERRCDARGVQAGLFEGCQNMAASALAGLECFCLPQISASVLCVRCQLLKNQRYQLCSTSKRPPKSAVHCCQIRLLPYCTLHLPLSLCVAACLPINTIVQLSTYNSGQQQTQSAASRSPKKVFEIVVSPSRAPGCLLSDVHHGVLSCPAATCRRAQT